MKGLPAMAGLLRATYSGRPHDVLMLSSIDATASSVYPIG